TELVDPSQERVGRRREIGALEIRLPLEEAGALSGGVPHLDGQAELRRVAISVGGKANLLVGHPDRELGTRLAGPVAERDGGGMESEIPDRGGRVSRG